MFEMKSRNANWMLRLEKRLPQTSSYIQRITGELHHNRCKPFTDEHQLQLVNKRLLESCALVDPLEWTHDARSPVTRQGYILDLL
jgi:hypothetical protein